MTELSPARRVALSILLDLEMTGAYARDGLDASDELRELSQRDAGLATRLVLGVVATCGCLDELIDTYCEKPGRMNARIREALRIATFELVYLGTEPRAAVSQGVELVRTRAKSAAGFANAVLRHIDRDRAAYLGAEDVPAGHEREVVSLARRCGIPSWLMERIVAGVGVDRADMLVEAQLEPAPVAVQVSPLDAQVDAELRELRGSDNDPAPSAPLVPGCVAPVPAARLMHTELLRRSALAVCDAHAQVVASAAVMPGTCLEVGSGRGTKTFVMAAQAARFGIERTAIGVELSKKKNRMNRRRLERSGLNEGIRLVTGDACELDRTLSERDERAGGRVLFDSVLVDAPCTGVGTMRRHPEIPWRLAPKDISRAMPELQLALLSQAASRVAAGGQLVYATCSVLAEENEQVVDAFLKSPEGASFKLVPVSEAPFFMRDECREVKAAVRAQETGRGCFATTPELGGFDGHFCARFERIL